MFIYVIGNNSKPTGLSPLAGHSVCKPRPAEMETQEVGPISTAILVQEKRTNGSRGQTEPELLKRIALEGFYRVSLEWRFKSLANPNGQLFMRLCEFRSCKSKLASSAKLNLYLLLGATENVGVPNGF